MSPQCLCSQSFFRQVRLRARATPAPVAPAQQVQGADFRPVLVVAFPQALAEDCPPVLAGAYQTALPDGGRTDPWKGIEGAVCGDTLWGQLGNRIA